MYTKIQVAFDAADPPKLAAFWALALGCIPEPPPEGFASWEDFGRSIGMPEERFGDQAAVIDPEGAGPRVYFQRVPEGKTSKNRCISTCGWPAWRYGGRNARPIEEQVARLTGAGASIAWRENDIRGSSVVMRDPEANEFCVV